jgi:nucleoside-diphosphate-sugar epimerase
LDKISRLVAAMCTAVPPGRASLDQREVALLRPLTRLLMSESPKSETEYLRYLGIRDRTLPMPMETVGGWVQDKTIVVTGGTGCIGSALIAHLTRLRARRVVSVSRGMTRGWPRSRGAQYVRADVRDESALMSVVAGVRPDVVFHVAAQRDPGLAERAVGQTVTTNVLGTRNVIAAAERAGVPRIVFASTGKTVIPYSPDVYSASKRIAEWLAANAARSGDILCTAARFTHIVDNSIVRQRISEGCENGLIRIHGADSAFYAQSALESAQLLICAGLESPAGSLGVHAISDLGWPVDLLSLALGALSHTGSDAVIYFSGYDPGYRGYVPFPGQYDPYASWETSPLINAFEAAIGRRLEYGDIDIFPRSPLISAKLDDRFLALQETCLMTQDPELIRNELDALSWSIFDATLDTIPVAALQRIVDSGITRDAPETMAHPRILAAMESRVARPMSRVAGAPGGNGRGA